MSDGSPNSSPSNRKELNGEGSCPDDSSMSAQELNHTQSSDGDNDSETEYDPEILAAIEASREEAETEYVDPQIAAAIAASMKEAEIEKEEDNQKDSELGKENSEQNFENKQSTIEKNSHNNENRIEEHVEYENVKESSTENLLDSDKSSSVKENKADGEEKQETENSRQEDSNNQDHVEEEEKEKQWEDEENNDTELKQEGEIELEGEPEIEENPFEDEDDGDASNPLDDDDYDPLNDQIDENEEANEGENNGFLDQVNSGKLAPKSNGTTKKKRANPVYITPIKKARKRSYSDSSNEDDIPDGDSDFVPGSGSKKSRSSPRKPKKVRPKRSPKTEHVLFNCTICNFNSEILGELNIHKYSNHKNQAKPGYLDMAEVVIAKLDDKSGSNKTNILKQMLSDHPDLIPEEKNTASQILSRALNGGVNLGRIRETKKGGKGAANYWIVSKEKRRIVLEKWRKNKKSVEHKDIKGIAEGSKEFLAIKEKLTKYNIQMTTAPKSASPPPDTKNYGRGKRASRPPPLGSVITHSDNSDDEIAIIEEKITPKTKMRLLHKKKILAKGGGAKTVIRVNSAQGKQLLRKIATTGAVPKAANSVTKPTIKKDEEDSDDDSQLTCSICLSSFWYANQTYDHMKTAHSIENPEKFIKDRLKK